MPSANTAAVDRFKDLVVVLEDLIKRVADTDDPVIRGMRAKVRADLVNLAADAAPILQWSTPPLRTLSAPAIAAPVPQTERRYRRNGETELPAVVAFAGVAVALTGVAYALALLTED